MNSGSFFRLDLETSKVVDGVAFFNYLDLPELDAGAYEVQYPVRLVIARDHVTFLVHYYMEDTIPRHTEEVILDLPFASRNPEALASVIKHSYNSAFPLSDYLRNLLRRRYIDNNTKYSHIRSSQINKDSYSSLSIWGLIDTKDEQKNEDEPLYSYNIQDSGKITKFLRKLLLDFMFDLMHSDVFESSKYYTQMREGLMTDFFFSSIVKKCEFYYNRRLVKNRLCRVLPDGKYLLDYSDYRHELFRIKRWRTTHKWRIQELIYNKLKLEEKLDDNETGFNMVMQAHRPTNTVLDSIRVLYAEEFKDAESAWVDTIMSPLAEKHFPFSPEWFENTVDRKKHKGFSLSDSWFVNPEEEMNRVMFPLDENEDERKYGKKNLKQVIHYLNSYELSQLIGTVDRSSISSQNSRISKWYYSRFDFRDAFRIHLFKWWYAVFFSFLAAIFLFSIASFIWPRLLEHSGYLSLFFLAASLGCFGTAIGFKNNIENAKNDPPDKLDDLLVTKRRIRECRKTLRLGLGFLGIGLFVFFSESSHWAFLTCKLMLLVFSIILLLGYQRKENGIDNAHLFFPRLVASITAAWIMLVIGNDLFKERLTIPAWIIIFFIVFVFILYENNKTLPNLSTGKKALRALELIAISYVISLLVGIFAIDVIVSDPETLCKLRCAGTAVHEWPLLTGCEGLTLRVCPHYLVPFSFLAMFIGVFIQMIFEEKSITEL